jgi:hypothetical protein
MKLPASIKQGTEFNPAAVELLRNEVQTHLKNMRLDRAAILAVRAEPLFPPPDEEDRFRDRERDENIKCILQHLLSFLDLVPGTVQYENPELNPIGQFRRCMHFQVKLLTSDDVKKAVFAEVNEFGPSNGDNVWDYLERISEKNRELQELMAMAAGEDASALYAMCLVLEQFCLFWFDVTQGRLPRIRRSDILMYKLSRMLQDRYQQERQKARTPVDGPSPDADA